MSVDHYELLPVEVIRLVGLGYRVEASPVPGQVVMVRGRRPNHILHLLLSVVTFGLWLPVWLVIGVTAREHRMVLSEASLVARGPMPVPGQWMRMSRREIGIYLAVYLIAVGVGMVVMALTGMLA